MCGGFIGRIWTEMASPLLLRFDRYCSNFAASGDARSRTPLQLGRRHERDDLGVRLDELDSGLSPAALDHLLQPFYTTKSTSLGLGLSICR
jgi:C4-dicarboxylate-specific signal transduction histidine kinase